MLKITETPLKWQNPVDGFQYLIETPEGQKWDAQLIFNTIDRFASAAVEATLEKQGVHPTDTCAHINEFYPNGRWLNEKVGDKMRTWRGTEVLEYLINKAQGRGAKVVYVYSLKNIHASILAQTRIYRSWKDALC